MQKNETLFSHPEPETEGIHHHFYDKLSVTFNPPPPSLLSKQILFDHSPADRMIEVLILLERLHREVPVHLVQSAVPVAEK